ncbi:MAG: hypothetical protein ACE1ZM_00690, partial [Gammaproteobacteria bacterium]
EIRDYYSYINILAYVTLPIVTFASGIIVSAATATATTTTTEEANLFFFTENLLCFFFTDTAIDSPHDNNDPLLSSIKTSIDP